MSVTVEDVAEVAGKAAAAEFQYGMDGIPYTKAEAKVFMDGQRHWRFNAIAWNGNRSQYKERFNRAYDAAFLAALGLA